MIVWRTLPTWPFGDERLQRYCHHLLELQVGYRSPADPLQCFVRQSEGVGSHASPLDKIRRVLERSRVRPAAARLARSPAASRACAAVRRSAGGPRWATRGTRWASGGT